MVEALGDAVETKVVESVGFGPDALRVLRQLARDGYKLIHTTSFGYMDQTLEAAKELPDVKFMHLDGYKSQDPNMGHFSLRYYEPSYLAGAVLDGTWTNAPVWESMADGSVAIAPLGEGVDAATAEKVAAKAKEFKAGTFHPFAGPIRDNTGAMRVEAGQTLDDSALYGMNWYVEGVVGTVPK